jgi:hypothetical protein
MFDGRVYASAETKKDESPIDGPALTVLGMTTVETLYAGLSEASVSDGFLNRFLFVTAKQPEGIIRPPKLDHDAAPPTGLIKAAKEAVTNFPRAAGGIPGHEKKHVVPFEGGEEGEAYRRWGEVFVWQQTAGTDITGRAAKNTVRLATIRAISRSVAEPSVNLDDVEWGWAIVHSSIELIQDGIRRHMSASPAEALRKAIVEALACSGDHTLAHSHLMKRRGVRGVDIRELEGAIRWLIESCEITDVARRTKPGPGSKYKLNPLP